MATRQPHLRRDRLPSLKDASRARTAAAAAATASPSQQKQAAGAAPRKACRNPQCSKPDIQELDGYRVCLSCGTMLSETNIVSDVTFGETSTGAAVVQGAFIGEGQRHAKTMGAAFRRAGGGGESREQTEAHGREEIRRLSASLRTPQSTDDQAFQIYRLAIQNNFIQGRRVTTVAAVCLYIACRRNPRNTVLLMDLAEKIQVNVFKLGSVYQDLLNALWISERGRSGMTAFIEVEPLIEKFARKLEFGNDCQKVAEDALKILQRMNRDWMVTGRQPAGLCGACILLAARMNNFRRTVREIVYVVRVADATVKLRLEEFQRTQSSTLTIDEFRKIAHLIKTQHDPPSVYRAREKEAKAAKAARAKRRREGTATESDDAASSGSETEENESTVDEDENESTFNEDESESTLNEDESESTVEEDEVRPATRRRSSRIAAGRGPEENTPSDGRQQSTEAEATTAVSTTSTEHSTPTDASADPSSSTENQPSVSTHQRDADGFLIPNLPARKSTRQQDTRSSKNSSPRRTASPSTKPSPNKKSSPGKKASSRKDPRPDKPPKRTKKSKRPAPTPPTTADLAIEGQLEDEIEEIVHDPSVLAELEAQRFAASASRAKHLADATRGASRVPTAIEIDASEFADDPEVAHCQLTPAEIAVKERIWVTHNEDWLRAQQDKMLKRAVLEAAGGPTAGNRPKRAKKRGRMGDGSVLEGGDPVTSPAEANQRMLAKRGARGFSRHINYEKLNAIYRDDEDDGASAAGAGEGGSASEGSSAVEGRRERSPSAEVLEELDDGPPALPEVRRAAFRGGAAGEFEEEEEAEALEVDEEVEAMRAGIDMGYMEDDGGYDDDYRYDGDDAEEYD